MNRPRLRTAQADTVRATRSPAIVGRGRRSSLPPGTVALRDLPGARPGGPLREVVLVAQRTAGNKAVSAVLQRRNAVAVRRPKGKATFATGFTAAAPNFLDAFAGYTTADNFRSGPKTFPADETGEKSLDSALANARVLMTLLTDPTRFDQLAVASSVWDLNRPTVAKVFMWAGLYDFPAGPAADGLNRLDLRLHKTEAALAVRAGTARAEFAEPEAGLLEKENRQLEVVFAAFRRLADRSRAVEWSKRHYVRAGTAVASDVWTRAGVADAEIQALIHNANVFRTAVGLAALFEESLTLSERYAAARKRGLLPAAATLTKFMAHAALVSGDASAMVVRSLAARAALQVELWTKLGDPVMEQRWASRAASLGRWGRFLAGGAGAFQMVSGTLDFLDAIDRDDPRAEVAAAHTIAQGAASVVGVALGAGALATTAVSGGLAAVWIAIDTVFVVADIIAGFRNARELDEVAAILRHAASVIPHGKRMAGAADALTAVHTSDPAHAAGVEEEIRRLAQEPFGIVVKHLLGIRASLGSHAALLPILGAKGQQALSRLSYYEHWRPGDPLSPSEILGMTELCQDLYPALLRAGAWALYTYGPDADTEEAKAARRKLEAAARN